MERLKEWNNWINQKLLDRQKLIQQGLVKLTLKGDLDGIQKAIDSQK